MSDINRINSLTETNTLLVDNLQNKNNESNNKKKHITVSNVLKVTNFSNPDTSPTMFVGGVTDIKGSLLLIDHTNMASNIEQWGRVHYDNGSLKLDNSIILTAANAISILGNTNLINDTGDTDIINTANGTKINIDAQGTGSDVLIKAYDDITINPADSLIINANKIIYNTDTINIGNGSGGEIVATSADGTAHNPVNGYVYLSVVSGSDSSTFHWDLTSFSGTNGQILHLIYDFIPYKYKIKAGKSHT